MPLECYVKHAFTPPIKQRIDNANEIIAKFQAMGFTLTLRQLYYQFVSHKGFETDTYAYDRLGDTLNNARLAGLVDWDAIEDRTRNLSNNFHWGSPAHLITSAANWFDVDMWEGQPVVPEVWIEKDALIGVIEPVCKELCVPYLALRGYCSVSEVWAAGKRIKRRRIMNGQDTVVLHLGDHDPSGLDMTRDSQKRLRVLGKSSWSKKTSSGTVWTTGDVKVIRLGLSMDQVKKYKLPPNPVKEKDARLKDYMVKYNTKDCWELDALDPPVIAQLIRDAVEPMIDEEAWKAQLEKQEQGRKQLQDVAYNWDDLTWPGKDDPDDPDAPDEDEEDTDDPDDTE